jgi:hypothetical protein
MAILTLILSVMSVMGAGQAFAASSERVLWSFGGRGDGANPYAGLITDKSGELRRYGVSAWCGASVALATAGPLTPV